ncbi:MAG: PQQ-binding-like beta-propeller repeat protein, partial [Halioglobus sp.]|nr:PQQ-binding-like beta-propeller repeat protein [Halioglobus sp.]
LDEHGLPGSRPPWGSLVAIDTNTGRITWTVPLGDYPQALAMGLEGLGAANYGGPVVTGGDLVFIAATPDSRIRAFDKYSGELLWQDALPAAGFATPAVYRAGGRQFIVIAAGGGRLRQASGSAYVAYALPEP